MKKRIAAVLGAVGLFLGLTAGQSAAVPIVCGAGLEGQLVNCGGTLTVNAAANTVTITFTTFTVQGGGDGNIQWFGIQFPDAGQTVNAATSVLPAGYTIGNFGGNGFAFEAEGGTSGVGTMGVGDTPIVFTVGYNFAGVDPVDTAYVAAANQNGKCGSFNGNVWGCLHVQFAPNIADADCAQGSCASQFVPLRASTQTPEPATMLLLGSGLAAAAVAGRKARQVNARK